MISKAKAPLRLGLAGGGTDVSPYCDAFGGMVVNATIDLYAYAQVHEIPGDKICFTFGEYQSLTIDIMRFSDPRNYPPPFDLYAGVYHWFSTEFGTKPLMISAQVDVPLGSGLGTSSTLVVAMVGALLDHVKKLKTAEEIASIAIYIERTLLRHEGGRQDQFAASFGGINALYFSDTVTVKPIETSAYFRESVSSNLILYYTAHDRFSSSIIREQIDRADSGDKKALNAMHALKEQAKNMLLAFQNQDLTTIASLLNIGFQEKKKMASGISNDRIEAVYTAALQAGAVSGKISGAGGGGFMIFFCDPKNRTKVIEALCTFGGQVFPFTFSNQGLVTWNEA